MRIAIVSDIHGNRTAFDAVLNDLREMSPDLVLHGGDLADGGSSPSEIVDRVRDLGWRGVAGNADEMCSRPESLEEFAARSSAPPLLWNAVREMAAATRAALGDDRIHWLGQLPRVVIEGGVGLVHASPESCWSSPGQDAEDAQLELVYAPLGTPIGVYGHIHRPFIRTISRGGSERVIVANAGSVSLSYDGDHRAAYLLVDGARAVIRRVDYELETELKALAECRLPYSEWIARMLVSASPQMP